MGYNSTLKANLLEDLDVVFLKLLAENLYIDNYLFKGR